MLVDVEAVAAQIPRILRYIVPGFLILLLWELSGLSGSTGSLATMSNTKLITSIVLLGPVYYSFHRVIFWILDDALFSRSGQDCWSFFKERYDPKNESIRHIVDYMNYRWSVLHLCLMSSELGFIFSCVCRDRSVICNMGLWLPGCAVVLFTTSVVMFWYLHRVELKGLFGDPPREPETTQGPAERSSDSSS